MRCLLSILFCSFFSWIQAQNLVINGGFERQIPKEVSGGISRPQICQFSRNPQGWNDNALGWRTFDTQTPDLLLWDSSAVCPLFPKPHRGGRMAGLILYHPYQDGQQSLDYHEMMQGSLVRPLEKGKTYRISFWVYTNDSLGSNHLEAVFGRPGLTRPIFCGNFGFYFSADKIRANEDFANSQKEFPTIPQVNYTEIVYPNTNWQKISLNFKADQAYKYFLFGNFYPDAATPANMEQEERINLDVSNWRKTFWDKTKRIAYYLFDDFAIEEEGTNAIEQALLEKKQYTFQSSLLFDSGESVLKPESQAAIAELASALKNNPKLKIEIAGHTDNVGEDQNNLQLSEQRAQSVYDALIAKQVSSTQLSWKGYGESSPCDSNETATGRQKNRRVACKVL